MVSRTPSSAAAGFTLMELVCAFAVLSILISMAFLGTANKFGQVRRDYQETLALQALSGRLEQLQVDRKPLEPGVTEFPLPPTARKLLHEATTTQSIKQREPGLYEVEATVQWTPTGNHSPVTATLKTLVVRERPKPPETQPEEQPDKQPENKQDKEPK